MDPLDDRLTAAELTDREREVLELVALGMSAKQIASKAGIAPRTVERHVENVRHKLRARYKTHMICKAIAHGLLHVEPNASWPANKAAHDAGRKRAING